MGKRGSLNCASDGKKKRKTQKAKKKKEKDVSYQQNDLDPSEGISDEEGDHKPNLFCGLFGRRKSKKKTSQSDVSLQIYQSKTVRQPETNRTDAMHQNAIGVSVGNNDRTASVSPTQSNVGKLTEVSVTEEKQVQTFVMQNSDRANSSSLVEYERPPGRLGLADDTSRPLSADNDVSAFDNQMKTDKINPKTSQQHHRKATKNTSSRNESNNLKIMVQEQENATSSHEGTPRQGDIPSDWEKNDVGLNKTNEREAQQISQKAHTQSLQTQEHTNESSDGFKPNKAIGQQALTNKVNHKNVRKNVVNPAGVNKRGHQDTGKAGVMKSGDIKPTEPEKTQAWVAKRQRKASEGTEKETPQTSSPQRTEHNSMTQQRHLPNQVVAAERNQHIYPPVAGQTNNAGPRSSAGSSENASLSNDSLPGVPQGACQGSMDDGEDSSVKSIMSLGSINLTDKNSKQESRKCEVISHGNTNPQHGQILHATKKERNRLVEDSGQTEFSKEEQLEDVAAKDYDDHNSDSEYYSSKETITSPNECNKGNPYTEGQSVSKKKKKGKKRKNRQQTNKTTDIPGALPNIGATCYANSVLQVLGQTPGFLQCLEKCAYSQNAPELVGCLRTLLQQLTTKSNVTRNNVGRLMNYITRKDDSFELGHQNDCHSFLLSLINLLKRDMPEGSLKLFQGKQCNMFSYSTCRHVEKSEEQIFQNGLEMLVGEEEYDENMIPCRDCDEEEEKAEKEALAKLEAEKAHTNSGTKTKQNQTDGTSGARSGKTGTSHDSRQKMKTEVEEKPEPKKSLRDETITTKKTVITELPEILILHIGRFEEVPVRENSMYKKLEKMNCFVQYEEEMDISKFCDKKQALYRLYAVISHSGSLKGGHYYANVRRINTNDWFYCSDSNIEATSCDKFKDSSAYVLFYSRYKVEKTSF